MRLLFDQNLSHRLVSRLTDLFPQSVHVRFAGLDRAPDDQIWDHAKTHGYCIVTYDADFAERSRLYGAPPKVLWLRWSNCTPQQVESMLRGNALLIHRAESKSEFELFGAFLTDSARRLTIRIPPGEIIDPQLGFLAIGNCSR